MKKVHFIYCLSAVLLFSFFGCATTNFLVPMDIQEAQQAIEQARASGAEKNCPDEYQAVVSLWDEALALYKTCNCKRKGIEELHAVRDKARMLCKDKDSDGDGVLDNMDKCPGTPRGVKVDAHGCPPKAESDSDGDGVTDSMDKCPNTPKGVAVDTQGCPMDSDGDGVPDYLDKCPNTPKGVKVDAHGCPLESDSDGDGVPDSMDKCPNTPKGVAVDTQGCPMDSDGDGVPDYLDKCPNTPKGVKVDSNGCPPDMDADSVPDYMDQCPRTPKGATVNSVGCWVCNDVEFDFDKWVIKPQFYLNLDNAIKCMKESREIKVEIQGHTDNIGTKEYNQILSEKRANAVMEYFQNKGIDKERLTSKGYGFSKPIASNETREGRAKNRRVELKPIY